MKKRGIFSLVLLLALSPLFAAQDITDLGTAFELVVAESSLAEAQTNTASSVSVLGKDDIAAYNAQTTAELVGKAIGTSFNSYGSLGALQTVVIRGATSSKNLIYLDGVLLSSAHNGAVDLSIIPIDIIESIEIIKSGPGNLGRTNAIGGMVNIITKKGQKSETPFSLTVENGSFLPLPYGINDDRNWASLVDSRKYELSYTNENLVVSIGDLTAQNAYTYDNAGTKLRDNTQVYEVHGAVNYTEELSDLANLSTQNLVSYKNLGLPGSTAFGLTPDDYEKDLLLSTQNKLALRTPSPQFEEVTAYISYVYAQTLFHDADADYSTVGDQPADSIHHKHKGSAQVNGVWNLGEQYALTTDLLYTMDYIDSTDINQNARHDIGASANGSLYFYDGKLSLHPSVNLHYITDIETLSPNASLGTIYTAAKGLDVKATLSYAENIPTFSDLYWPYTDFGWGYTYVGNPNLKPEKGVNADAGLAYTRGNLSYEGMLFGRNIYNAIDASGSMPVNIAHSVYIGTEQTITASLFDALSLKMSYQYNKSFDLSSGKTFEDNAEVPYIRNHTIKGSVTYTGKAYDLTLDGTYASATKDSYGATWDDYLFFNLVTNVYLSETLTTYLAIDNVLNAAYELSAGYPMPGTKIRLGGKLRF